MRIHFNPSRWFACCVCAVLLAAPTWFSAQAAPDKAELEVPAKNAPALMSASITSETQLGLWDDIYVPKDADFIVLRKGDSLFQQSLYPGSKPQQLLTNPQLAPTRIVTGTASKDKSWLFFHSNGSNPFALEWTSKKLVRFDIPGVKVPGAQTADIQSWVFGPHSSGVLLMISGGDQPSWPRDGNRPVYFWLNLNSGDSKMMPVGWDLDYFSADLATAVFDGPQEKEFARRSLAGVDMSTGESVSDIPGRDAKEFVAFDWTNQDQAKPLLAKRIPKDGDIDRLTGISDDGVVYPFQISLENPYIPSVKTSALWALIHLRGYGNPREESYSLWGALKQENGIPKLIAQHVRHFEIFGDEQCLFSVQGPAQKRGSEEAFVYDLDGDSAWNVLEGVERLKELEPDLREKSFIQDAMNIKLVTDFGSNKERSLALVLFSESRGDMRAFAWPGTEGPLMKNQTWHTAMLLTDKNERYQIKDAQDWIGVDQVWLHNSGKVLLGKYVWPTDQAEGRRVQLSQIELELINKK